MNYYLGVDIGTTSVKAVAFNGQGVPIGKRSFSYPMAHTAPDRSELDPDEILRGVTACINEVTRDLSPGRPELVSFSSAMHSLLAIDERERPLTPCMIWADNRAASIAQGLSLNGKGKTFYNATGVPIHAMTPLCKLLWLRREEPALFDSAAAFIGIKEYVFGHLFGQRPVDSSIASATGLLNSQTLDWDEDILRYISVDRSKLARVVSPRHIISYERNGGPALSLPPGTPIVVGCSDGASANLATGASGNHIMAVTIGTSGAARMILSGVGVDSAMRTFRYHVRDNEYISGGATNNGAVVLQWLKENLLQSDDSYEQLFELAGTVPPGSDGLLFIPYILGERAPIWNSKAKGFYFGLEIRHTKAHLVRAAMEGVIYAVYSIGKILAENRDITELHATGGFSRSPLWLQMLADVFNVKVLTFGEEESAVMGAVVVGMEAVGKDTAFQRQPLAIYSPSPSAHDVYRERVEKYMRLYEMVKNEF
ncbi:MAG: gluconokinase [Bacteroidetes bacterium]|nr:gluconokinase [Bacteroidota bacterium]